MLTDTNIRPVMPSDLHALKTIIEANGLFPSDMLDEMISDYFDHKNASDFWLTYEDNEPVAIAYYAPERMTEGTWNLYLIVVHPDYQGKGLGTSLLHYIEQMLAARGERVLLVETSGLASFEGTRSFYRKCGYQEEAKIREFYQAGEDKIIFRKSLKDNK
jgi:GNAT superfamily N-acetyltransferase